jgi:hypothetical protein
VHFLFCTSMHNKPTNALKGKGHPITGHERPQRGSRGIVLLILVLGAGRGWVVSTTPRPLYPRERPVTHCTGNWVGPGPVWTCAKNLSSTEIRSPDSSARSQSLYRLSYPVQQMHYTDCLLITSYRSYMFQCMYVIIIF